MELLGVLMDSRRRLSRPERLNLELQQNHLIKRPRLVLLQWISLEHLSNG